MASVTYKIGGKYDGKALKSAKKDLSDLAGVVKGLAVVKAGQQLLKIANATKSVFTEQNKALAGFNVAVQKSGLELQKLNNLKKQLSHGNFIDDDSLNNAMKLGMQMGLNQEQLEKVMKASTELASAGVMPLDQAVKTLSQSYSGQSGQIGKLLPDVKNLTKEQLANGDAIDMVIAKYDGFADAMSNTFSGRDTQWKNSIADLQASIGAIPKSLEFLTQGKLLQPLNDITQWFVTNRNSIINFFLHLPEVFKTIGIELTKMLKKTFEQMPEWFSSIGVYFVQLFKDGFTTIFTIAKEKFQGMMELLDFAIGNPFRSSKNFINTMLNNLIEGLNGLADKLPKWARDLFGIGNDGAIKFRFEVGQNDLNKTWGETVSKLEESASNIMKAYKDGAKKTKDDWLKIFNASKDFYSTNIDDLKTRLSEILGQDLPEELQSALDGLEIKGTVVTTDGSESSSTGTSSSGNAMQDFGMKMLDELGEIGDIVKGAMQNGWIGAIAVLVEKIFARLEQVAPLLQFVQSIISELLEVIIGENSEIVQYLNEMLQPFLDGFNAVKDILSSFVDVVAQIFNAFTQVFNGLTAILNRIAPVISSILQVVALLVNGLAVIGEIITPIVEVIMEVIAPVLEVINQFIKAIYTFLASIVNVVIDIYNAINGWGKDISHVNTTMKTQSSSVKGYSSYTPDLSSYVTASSLASTTSGSASYQAGKDIYLNVIFEHSFVNSDGREVALMIRDELRNAEKLGY